MKMPFYFTCRTLKTYTPTYPPPKKKKHRCFISHLFGEKTETQLHDIRTALSMYLNTQLTTVHTRTYSGGLKRSKSEYFAVLAAGEGASSCVAVTGDSHCQTAAI